MNETRDRMSSRLSGSAGIERDPVVLNALPVHHAIDYATVLSIELQRLRRMRVAGHTVSEAELVHLEALVGRLSRALVACRDG